MKTLKQLLVDPEYQQLYQDYQLNSGGPWEFSGEQLIRKLDDLIEFTQVNKSDPHLVYKELMTISPLLDCFYIADSLLYVVKTIAGSKGSPDYDPVLRSCHIYLQSHLELFAAANAISYERYLSWVPSSEIGIQFIPEDEMNKNILSDPQEANLNKKSSIKVIVKPLFKSELIPSIFGILKDYFTPVDQEHLKGLLNGGEILKSPIVFLSAGNRLADAFRQLIKKDLITGCNQVQLESWVAINFKYLKDEQVQTYTKSYLNKVISAKDDVCMNPILDIKVNSTSGEISIVKA